MLIGINYSKKVFANSTKKQEVSKQTDVLLENKFEVSNEIIENQVNISIEKKIEKSVKLSFVGDCLLGSDLSYGLGSSFVDVFEKKNRDVNYFFENVYPIFEKDDITVANLENPLTNSTAKMKKEFVFKGEPYYAKILKAGSIEAVNIENNHIQDYYAKGYEDTKISLENEQIGFFGGNINYIKEVNGIKIGFLGYKGWNDNTTIKKQISKEIQNLKENNVDIVVVSFHWGEEKNNYPNNIQKSLARYTIDNGADIIIGHHPHVISGIEIYKDKPIVYSLGNFSFGGNRNPSDKDTFIYQHTFTYEDDKKISSDIKIIPCSISSVSNKNDFKPTPLVGSDADRLLSRIIQYSPDENSKQFVRDKFYIFNSEIAK